MPRKKRQVAMNPSRALQSLRRIKNIQPDDLGDLGFILSSETSPLVRCHNHSFTVAMQKQMDIWYRHHVTTMRKLSHGQQSEYRNLMKVKVKAKVKLLSIHFIWLYCWLRRVSISMQGIAILWPASLFMLIEILSPMHSHRDVFPASGRQNN